MSFFWCCVVECWCARALPVFGQVCFLVAWCDAPEEVPHERPLVEEGGGVWAVGEVVMALEEGADVAVVLSVEPRAGDVFGVQVAGEGAFGVKDVGESAGHACGEVAPGWSEDEDDAARHVFTAVVADAFDDGDGSAVAYGEAFACAACGIACAAGGSVKDGVADDGGFVPVVACVGGWADDDFAARHAFADVIVRFTSEEESYAWCEECAKALPCAAVAVDGDGACGES